TGLLPGALLRNAGIRFLCRRVVLRVETTDSPFTARYAPGARLSIPVAHHDGAYVADEATVEALRAEDRVAFRYADGAPNGSVDDIAGVLSENRRVLGMMPHPERAIDPLHGGTDGRLLFESLAETLVAA
ncbi:MAG: phosphoribosylformylglycinamidine synthase subunit PurQ, partial [Pseudomonadota bacterium]